MLIDEATITVKAGNGGPGKVSFFPGLKSGPNGGNGGKGGDVYAVLNTSMSDLNRYVSKKNYKAEHGKPGQTFLKYGADAPDFELPFPAGTTLQDLETSTVYEITKESPRYLLCRGGKGGRGNAEFKSSIKKAPRFAEPGKEGEEKHFKVVMRLIADFGFIGLPNAGKSSLLNELTRANVKVAPYAFTTLEPNLGVVDGKVIADIPGLIEGASQGKGLGIKFLKHIEKVQLLLHCIAADNENLTQTYTTVRTELKNFNSALSEKKEIILLTKSDLVDQKNLKLKQDELRQLNKEVLTVSIYDRDSIMQLQAFLQQL